MPGQPPDLVLAGLGRGEALGGAAQVFGEAEARAYKAPPTALAVLVRTVRAQEGSRWITRWAPPARSSRKG
ncbi:hypothetical protein [Streptomyces violascens]|uniref:hypothetical protein n=1 Tax=Streptomyces violascens TaxID=67381 RepID=UPI0016757A2A|nr:hypothetical protein [Streptomyces violascens]